MQRNSAFLQSLPQLYRHKEAVAIGFIIKVKNICSNTDFLGCCVENSRSFYSHSSRFSILIEEPIANLKLKQDAAKFLMALQFKILSIS